MARSNTSKALVLALCVLSAPALAQTTVVGRLGSGIPKGPDPPAVGGGGTYSVAYTVNTTGWLTVPIAAAQGEIPSGNGVSIGGLTTQLDVKNQWPDHSAKLAILTAKLASTGSKTITSASAPGGSFTPSAPVFSVTFTERANNLVPFYPVLTSSGSLGTPATYYYRYAVVNGTGHESFPSIPVSLSWNNTLSGTNKLRLEADLPAGSTSAKVYGRSAVTNQLLMATVTPSTPTISSITYAYPYATVTTSTPHNLYVDGVSPWLSDRVAISGAAQAEYNGTFVVASVPTSTSFTYYQTLVPAVTPATGSPTVSYFIYTDTGVDTPSGGFKADTTDDPGTVWTAALGSYSSADKWLIGPNAIEWRKTVTPTKTGPVSHDNLSVIFDVRSYNDGDHRINVQVLNARDNANMDWIAYDCKFINSGSPVYSAPTGLRHYTFTQWQKIVYLGAGSEATVTLDFTKFYSTYQLPKPLPGITNVDYTTQLADPTLFGPMKFGLINPLLATGGAGGYLGPVSTWDMQFLVNQSVTERAVILHHAFNSIGAFTQSRVTRNDGTPYRLDDATEGAMFIQPVTTGVYPAVLRTPTRVVSRAGNNTYRGGRALDDTFATLDDEHIPQVSLAAYLSTGDRYLVDTAKYFSTLTIFRTFGNVFYTSDLATDGSQIRDDRNAVTGAHGVSITQTGGIDPRAQARTIRNIIYAAQIVPDADPERSYFVSLVNDNMAWFAYYNAKRVPPGTQWGDGALFFDGYVGTPISGTTTGAFMQMFGAVEIGWDIYWASRQGVFTVPAGAITLAKRVVGLNVALVTHTAYLTEPARLGPYYPQVAKRLGPIGSSAMEFPATYADFAVLDDPATWCCSSLNYIIGGYGVTTRLAILLANYWDVANAATAKTIVDAYTNGSTTIEADAISSQQQYAIQIPQ